LSFRLNARSRQGVCATQSWLTDGLGSLHKVEFNFELVLAQVLERDAEFLKSPDIFHSDGDNLLLQYTLGILVHQDLVVEYLWLDHLLTNKLWNLDLTSEQDFEALHLGSLSSILEEVFHTAIEAIF